MFRIGQKIVRVKNGPAARFGLRVGNIYTVKGYCRQDDCEGGGIYLCEVVAEREGGVWCDCFDPEYFRPVVEKKTDISWAEEILRRESIDTPERVS